MATQLAVDAAPLLPISRSVTVVIPCLNERDTIQDAVQSAKRLVARSPQGGEVVVVDNGSTDGSQGLAAAAGARVIAEPRRGYGAALLRGFRSAGQGYLVMGDADATYDFAHAEAMLLALEDGADLVVGNRFANLEAGAMPLLHQRVGTPAISLSLRLVCGSRLRDSQCGLRALTTEAFLQLRLRAQGMEFASEMILHAYRAGLRVVEAPAGLRARRGEAKLRTFRDGWRHLRFLLLASPSIVYTFPALALILLALISTVFAFNAGSFPAIDMVSWQPIFASTIFLNLGALVLGLGVVASMLADRQHMARPDPVIRVLTGAWSLERGLLASAGILLSGLVLNALLLFAENSLESIWYRLAWAGLAQALIIVGANLGWLSLVVSLVKNSLSDVSTHGLQGTE